MLGVPVRILKSWDCGDRTPPQWTLQLVAEKLMRIMKEQAG